MHPSQQKNVLLFLLITITMANIYYYKWGLPSWVNSSMVIRYIKNVKTTASPISEDMTTRRKDDDDSNARHEKMSTPALLVEQSMLKSMEHDIKGLSLKTWRRDVLNKPDHFQRLSRAYDHCSKRKSGRFTNAMYDKDKKTSVCLLAKIGCTFWIATFRFINNDTGGVVYNSPSDISWENAHAYRNNFLLNNPGVKNSMIDETFRFMFVRNPWRRLWSAWLDKLFQPSYWCVHAGYIVRRLGLTGKELKCPVYISFVQFLTFISNERNPGQLDVHWRPIQFICDPCLFRPHLIGNMETFAQDSSTIISIMNNSLLLSKNSDNSGKSKSRFTISNEAAILTKWHEYYPNDRTWDGILKRSDASLLGLFRKSHPLNPENRLKGCGITPAFAAERIWVGHQRNGQIPDNIAFNMTDWSLELWFKKLHEAYSHWSSDTKERKKEQKQQRDKHFIEGYKAVPLNVIDKLKVIFKNDFEQFGYSKEIV